LLKKLPDYIILQAFDGFEAGKFFSEWRPGIIFLDINLPGIYGDKLCSKIKEDAGSNSPVIIAITGLDDPKEKELILKAGADAFFTKPLNLENLLSKLLELIDSHRGKNGRKVSSSDINS